MYAVLNIDSVGFIQGCYPSCYRTPLSTGAQQDNTVKYMKWNAASPISTVDVIPDFLYPTSFSQPSFPLLISSPPSWPLPRQTVSLWCTTLGIYILWLSSRKQSRLFTWLMSKWDFNSVTQPSPCGHICMSAFLIWKPSVLGTMKDLKIIFHPTDSFVAVIIFAIACFSYWFKFCKCFLWPFNTKRFVFLFPLLWETSLFYSLTDLLLDWVSTCVTCRQASSATTLFKQLI